MRFALFAVLAALALTTVSAEMVLRRDPLHLPEAGFSAQADGKAPTTQTFGWINALAQGATVAAAEQTLTAWNTTFALRTNATQVMSGFKVPFGKWQEFTLGKDGNYPTSFRVDSAYLATSSAGYIYVENNAFPQTSPVSLHYTFGIAYTGAPFPTPKIYYQAINDDKFVKFVNKTSSLFAFMNAVDTPASQVWIQCRNIGNTTADTPFPLPEVYLGYTWMPVTDAGSKQECAVYDTNASDRKQLAGFTPLTTKNNGLYVFLISGSMDNKAIFPVTVAILGSAATSPAATAVVSFALMALLAILAFATPALF